MNTCPNGHSVPVGAAFCPECGSPMSDSEVLQSAVISEPDFVIEPVVVSEPVVVVEEPVITEGSSTGIRYCTNCGQPMDPNAAICVRCGVAKNRAKKFCSHCGQSVSENQAVCINCGHKLKGGPVALRTTNQERSKAVYCTNCGQLMDPNASICVKCGVAKNKVLHYCANCGVQVNENQDVCTNCGARLAGTGLGSVFSGGGGDIAARISSGGALAAQREYSVGGRSFGLAHILAALSGLLALLTVFAFPLARIFGQSYSMQGMANFIGESFHDGWLLLIAIAVAIAFMFVSASWAKIVSVVAAAIALIIGIIVFRNAGQLDGYGFGILDTNGFTRFMFAFTPLLTLGATLMHLLRNRTNSEYIEEA